MDLIITIEIITVLEIIKNYCEKNCDLKIARPRMQSRSSTSVEI